MPTYAAQIIDQTHDQLGDYPETIVMRVGVEDDEPEFFASYAHGHDTAPEEALSDAGWSVDKESVQTVEPGYRVVSVTPSDWPAILRHVTLAHDTARVDMDRQESARRAAIVDAHAELRSGQAVAEAASISKGRVYQILENRSI